MQISYDVCKTVTYDSEDSFFLIIMVLVINGCLQEAIGMEILSANNH